MKETRGIELRCKLCGSRRNKIVRQVVSSAEQKKDAYKITDHGTDISLRLVKCEDCGLIYAADSIEENQILPIYEDMEDELYLQEEEGRRLSAKLLLSKINRIKKHGRLLDIGCATGFLLDEARRINYAVEGVELSRWATRIAKEKFGLKVHQGSILKIDFPTNYFDVIVMTDVIEHLSDPLKALTKIRRILKTGGLLYINTPDITSFFSRILGAKWWGLKELHLVYFSKKTIKDLLERAGFMIIRSGSYPRTFSIKYWIDTLSHYNVALAYLSKIFLGPINKERLLTIDFYDQLEFFIQKKRLLEFIEQDEDISVSPGPKEMKTVVVLPAFNAARTLSHTLKDIPADIVDDIILVDDCSKDDTMAVAKSLGLKAFRHDKNLGYGGNQKTCYKKALELGADIVVMVHPDYQYDAKAIPELVRPIKEGRADAVFGSRMMKGGSLEGGMPLWKHNANILLTALENIILKTYLTEYHSGFRAYSARLLRKIPFESNSNGFIFDTEIIVQILLHDFKIEEIPIKTRYFDEASTIKLWPSCVYGLGILKTLCKYILHEHRIFRFRQFK